MSSTDIYSSVAVTGPTGLVGSAICEALQARGIPFTALSHQDCDITDGQSIQRCFDRLKPTLLINCAAYTKVDASERERQRANLVNGDGPGLIGSVAVRYGTLVVHFSSNYVFDGKADNAYRANDAPQPLSAYGRSKVLGEQRLTQIPGLSWLIVRTAGVFGEGGPCFPRVVVERMSAGETMQVVDDQITSLALSNDVADATLDLLDSGVDGFWNVANAGQVSWFEFAQAICHEFELEDRIIPVSTDQWLKERPSSAIRPGYGVLELTDTEEMLDRSMRGWNDALRYYRTLVIGRE